MVLLILLTFLASLGYLILAPQLLLPVLEAFVTGNLSAAASVLIGAAIDLLTLPFCFLRTLDALKVRARRDQRISAVVLWRSVRRPRGCTARGVAEVDRRPRSRTLVVSCFKKPRHRTDARPLFPPCDIVLVSLRCLVLNENQETALGRVSRSVRARLESRARASAEDIDVGVVRRIDGSLLAEQDDSERYGGLGSVLRRARHAMRARPSTSRSSHAARSGC
jgi:hypothetical protein